MMQYLVVGRCGCDDIPIVVVPTKQEALEIAEGLTPDQINNAAQRVFGVSVSMFCAVSVVPIKDGRPLEGIHVKELD